MKKLLIVLCIASFGLVGCGSSNTQELDPNEQVTLKVMGWGWGAEDDPKNTDRAIVKAYEEAHPNVTIEMVSFEGDYEDDVAQLFTAGEAPDVYMYAGVDPVVNGWAMDISDYAKENEVYQNMPKLIKDDLEIDGKAYSIPTSINFMGIWQSQEVIDKLNMEGLKPGFTTEELIDVIIKTTTDSTLGISNFDPYMWMPPTMAEDSEDYWYNFNKETQTYNYDDPYFLQTINYVQKVCAAGAVEECNDNVLEEGEWAFDSGKLAYNYEATWQSQEILDNHGWKFLGLPGGEFTIIPDYMYVSNTSENPEWAVDFITYWANEGWKIKYDMAVESDGVIPIPLVQNDEYYELFLTAYNDAGQENIVKAYDAMMAGEAGIVEGFKVIPGFNLSVKEGDTGIPREDGDGTYNVQEVMNLVMQQQMNYDDVKDQLSELSNSEYETAMSVYQ